MIIAKLKEIEKYRDIVALDITCHAIGKEDYILRFFVKYGDSYSFKLLLYNRVTEKVEIIQANDDWFDKQEIKEEDICVITTEGNYKITELYESVRSACLH